MRGVETNSCRDKRDCKKEVNTRMLFADKESFCDFNKILQKISECEVNNAR